jgi:hypothetical protein
MSALPSTRTGVSEVESCSLPTGLARLKTCWWNEDSLSESLDLGLSTDRDTLEQAFRLVHDQYVARGYMSPAPSGWRLSLHNALPSTRVFVARSGGRVVGTLTLIPDSPLGLPMSEIYSDELAALRQSGRRIGEVSALVVDPEYKQIGMAILMRLIRMMIIYAAEAAGLEDLCIAINPHHAALYRKAFDFQTIGPIKHYGKVNGAPAVALRLDLGLVRALIRELKKEDHPDLAAVYGFLLGPDVCSEILAGITSDLVRGSFSRDHFEYFFRRHSAWLEASAADRAHVLSHYASRQAEEPAPSLAGLLSFGEFELPTLALAAAS